MQLAALSPILHASLPRRFGRAGWLAGWHSGCATGPDAGPSGALSRTFPTWRAATRGNNYCLIHHFSLNLPIIPELLSRLALDKSQDIRFMGNMPSSSTFVKPRRNVRHFAFGLKSELRSAYHRLSLLSLPLQLLCSRVCDGVQATSTWLSACSDYAVSIRRAVSTPTCKLSPASRRCYPLTAFDRRKKF
jgi:hypothetical protein